MVLVQKKTNRFRYTNTINLKTVCIGMKNQIEFKWKHYQADIIL